MAVYLTTPPDEAAPSVISTCWTRLTPLSDDLLRLMNGDLPVPPEVASLSEIALALQTTFHLSVNGVARLLGVSRHLALKGDLPDWMDRLYALSNLVDTLPESKEQVFGSFSRFQYRHGTH